MTAETHRRADRATRVALAYAARTYELLADVADLPRPGLSAAEVRSGRAAQARRAARGIPTTLLVLWTNWAAVFAVCLWVDLGRVRAFTSAVAAVPADRTPHGE